MGSVGGLNARFLCRCLSEVLEEMNTRGVEKAVELSS